VHDDLDGGKIKICLDERFLFFKKKVKKVEIAWVKCLLAKHSNFAGVTKKVKTQISI